MKTLLAIVLSLVATSVDARVICRLDKLPEGRMFVCEKVEGKGAHRMVVKYDAKGKIDYIEGGPVTIMKLTVIQASPPVKPVVTEPTVAPTNPDNPTIGIGADGRLEFK